MTREDAVNIVRLVKAMCPSQMIDQFTADAWAPILASSQYADAQQAIYDIASRPLEPGRSRYIEVGHILDGIARIRAKRLDAATPTPPSDLDAASYLAWLRTTTKDIADGRYRPGPAIDSKPRPELAACVPVARCATAQEDTND